MNNVLSPLLWCHVPYLLNLHLSCVFFHPELCPVARRAGRVGTAYSLLTRDELPYLLDLHLFLSRPLRPAPVQSIAAAAAAANDADPQTSVYGAFPLVSSTAPHCGV